MTNANHEAVASQIIKHALDIEFGANRTSYPVTDARIQKLIASVKAGRITRDHAFKRMSLEIGASYDAPSEQSRKITDGILIVLGVPEGIAAAA